MGRIDVPSWDISPDSLQCSPVAQVNTQKHVSIIHLSPVHLPPHSAAPELPLQQADCQLPFTDHLCATGKSAPETIAAAVYTNILLHDPIPVH